MPLIGHDVIDFYKRKELGEVDARGLLDVAISLDGSFDHTGTDATHCVSVAVEVYTGRPLDVIMTEKCTKCEKCNEYKDNGNCINGLFHGASGDMEKFNALALFQRSTKIGFRYTSFVGDGDCKNYKAIVDSKPYEIDPNKVKCANHLPKRGYKKWSHFGKWWTRTGLSKKKGKKKVQKNGQKNSKKSGQKKGQNKEQVTASNSIKKYFTQVPIPEPLPEEVPVISKNTSVQMVEPPVGSDSKPIEVIYKVLKPPPPLKPKTRKQPKLSTKLKDAMNSKGHTRSISSVFSAIEKEPLSESRRSQRLSSKPPVTYSDDDHEKVEPEVQDPPKGNPEPTATYTGKGKTTKGQKIKSSNEVTEKQVPITELEAESTLASTFSVPAWIRENLDNPLKTYPLRHIFTSQMCNRLARKYRLAVYSHCDDGPEVQSKAVHSILSHELDHKDTTPQQKIFYHRLCDKTCGFNKWLAAGNTA